MKGGQFAATNENLAGQYAQNMMKILPKTPDV